MHLLEILRWWRSDFQTLKSPPTELRFQPIIGVERSIFAVPKCLNPINLAQFRGLILLAMYILDTHRKAPTDPMRQKRSLNGQMTGQICIKFIVK